ncbi:MAG TPA: Type 1 glutamine amidotransferase-like domain-containing protein [Pyrinomonadaceae bacterium]
MTESVLKPVVLLADSQLLFWRESGQLVLERIIKDGGRLKAAYVGASNGDQPEFYSIFVAAMESLGIFDCRMIPSTLSEADIAFVNQAEVILLAGGDVEAGWRVFLQNGLSEHIVRRYFEGALLIGVSAGAVQLGLCGLAADGSLIETFKLVPFIIGAHEESDNWKTTMELLRLSGPGKTAIGLPTGGGAICHPDHTLESLRHPFVNIIPSATIP